MAHKGCEKGAARVLEPPFQQKGGGCRKSGKTVSDKSENQPPKGA